MIIKQTYIDNIEFNYIYPDITDYSSIFNQYQLMIKYIKNNGLRIVFLKIFGSIKEKKEILSEFVKINSVEGIQEFPISYIEGMPIKKNCIENFFFNSVKESNNSDNILKYRYLKNYSLPVLSQIKCKNIIFFYVCGLNKEFSTNNELKIEQLFYELKMIINNNNFENTDIIRTWFYLNEIEKNYIAFNKVRKNYFEQNKICIDINSIFLPASTCIEGRTCEEGLIYCDVLGVSKKSTNLKVQRVYNPLQIETDGDTYLYKPTFSRAVLVEYLNYKELQISGTASIGSTGDTLYPENAYKQIQTTLINIKNILEKNNFKFSDIAYSTCFLKDSSLFDVYKNVLTDLNISIPFETVVVANICRNDLLFEMDAVAIKS